MCRHTLLLGLVTDLDWSYQVGLTLPPATIWMWLGAPLFRVQKTSMKMCPVLEAVEGMPAQVQAMPSLEVCECQLLPLAVSQVQVLIASTGSKVLDMYGY